MKRVLIIAYYFPPMGAGGVQRTVKFARYLPEFGWKPVVLTVKDVLYHAHDASLLNEIKGCQIVRTGSLDPQRLLWKLSRFRGQKTNEGMRQHPSRFVEFLNQNVFSWLLTPDTKRLWLPHLMPKAKEIIREKKIDILFTTSPPQSVHLAGLNLKRKIGLPWVADFRDNWKTKQYERPPTSLHQRINERMIRRVLEEADKIVSVSDPITQDLQRRSGRGGNDFSTILNGYDKSDFEGIPSRSNESFTITYCGALDPTRNPEVFLKGVAQAIRRNPEIREELSIRFLGTAWGIDVAVMIRTMGLDDCVEIIGYVSHRQCLEYLMSSDLLLLLISEESGSEIITGKLFEYLASGKPIMAIAPGGEAGKLIVNHARGVVVPPDAVQAVADQIIRSFALWKRGDLKISVKRWEGLDAYQRKSQAKQLADIFDVVSCLGDETD